MGKNGRELNPMDKLRREEKEREKKRNKNFRVKSREVGHLRHDPRALQEEIRKSKRELYEGGEDDEGRAGLKRKIKRMEDEYNAAVRARKKADPKLMERLGLDPNDTNYNLTGKATEAPASDPLDPENGEESRLFARNRALNRVNPSNLSNPSTELGSANPQAPVLQAAKVPSRGLVALVPAALRKKAAVKTEGVGASRAAGTSGIGSSSGGVSGTPAIDLAPPVNE